MAGSWPSLDGFDRPCGLCLFFNPHHGCCYVTAWPPAQWPGHTPCWDVAHPRTRCQPLARLASDEGELGRGSLLISSCPGNRPLAVSGVIGYIWCAGTCPAGGWTPGRSRRRPASLRGRVPGVLARCHGCTLAATGGGRAAPRRGSSATDDGPHRTSPGDLDVAVSRGLLRLAFSARWPHPRPVGGTG